MSVPSEARCLELLGKYGAPENVIHHSEQVRRVANFVAQSLSAKGYRVDLDLVDRAAFLHDMAKAYCLKKGCSHAAEAAEMLKNEGFPEVAEVVRLHNLDEVLNFSDSTPLEAKVVWYADKRVTHEKVVSLRERFDYLKGRYGSVTAQKMNEIISAEKPAFELEKWFVIKAGLDDNFLRGWG